MRARWVMLTAILVVAVSRGSPAQTAPPASIPLTVAYSQFTLENGLHVILHEDHSVPMVSVNVWYHVGSANERPGRTGFAHLFEHLMFEGSKNVQEGEFDTLLESVGGNNNGSTNNDRTNYYIDVPSNGLELALFLESDRMAFLLDTMTPQRVDGQRDVVKNERRQSYENQPYGMASIVLSEMLYPKSHPYHWPTIGYMEDLTAAGYEDVVEFFRKYYAPNNASLVIAGDINPSDTRKLVEKWFSEVRRGEPVEPVVPPPVMLTRVERRTITDRVQLPRLFLAWVTPAAYAPGDAALDVVSSVLAGGKNSRLYKRLVYDEQVAQNVSAVQQSGRLASEFVIDVIPRPGHTVEEMQKIIDQELEKLKATPPDAREVERALNQIEASFYSAMESVGGYAGKANQLNAYYASTGNPDYFAEDLARYRALTPPDIQAIAQRFLPTDRRIELVVMPDGDSRR
ncbi:MAG TPA: pitrilysin family protein [Vicinamibacterales bacterium]|jgi:zinc protease